MSNWADEAAEFLLKEAQAQEVAAFQSANREKNRQAKGPALWAELRDGLRQSCGVKSPSGKPLIAFDVCPTSEAQLRVVSGGRANLIFDKESLIVFVEFHGKYPGRMLFKVVPVTDTDVVFEDLDGNLADSKTVGTTIMNFLVGRN